MPLYPPQKRWLRLLAKITISAALLVYIWLSLDWGATKAIIAQSKLSLLLLSTVIAVGMVAVVGWNYVLLTRGTPVECSFRESVRINFVVRFHAIFLPAGIGAEIVRFFHVTKGKTGRVSFMVRTVFERLSFIFLTALTASMGLVYAWQDSRLQSFVKGIVPVDVAALGLALAGILWLCQLSVNRRIDGVLAHLGGLLPAHWREKFGSTFVIQDHRVAGSLVFMVLATGLVWQAAYLARFYFLFEAIEIHLGIANVAWIGALVLLLQTLPISFAGIGVREGALAFMVSMFGLPKEIGVVIGALFFLQMLIVAMIGLLLQHVRVEAANLTTES